MTENRCFEKVDFSSLTGEEEFYDCRFVSCDFSEVLFREPLFERCEFQACNFSMTKFRNTVREIRFTDCKLMGTDFSGLKPFSSDLSFVRSRMDYANFSGVRLRKSRFQECRLFEAAFDGADLSGSLFERCDLERTLFNGTNLEGADFSTSYNFVINPGRCRLRKAVFPEAGLSGLLAHLDIKIV